MIRERALCWLGFPATGPVALRWPARLSAYRLCRPVWMKQAIRYSVVGVLNTLLDASLYLLLTHFWLGVASLRILAKGISYAISTVNSFHWNRSWTFNSRASAMATFLPFVIASLMALAINSATMYVGLELDGQREIPALAAATGITLLWNYGVSKFIVFRR